MNLPEFLFGVLSDLYPSVLEVGIRISEICEAIQGYHERGLPLAKVYCSMLGICEEPLYDPEYLRLVMGLRNCMKQEMNSNYNGESTINTPTLNGSIEKHSEKKQMPVLHLEEWGKLKFSVDKMKHKIKHFNVLPGKLWEDWETGVSIFLKDKANANKESLNKAAQKLMSQTLPLFTVISGKIKKTEFSEVLNHLSSTLSKIDSENTGEVSFSVFCDWLMNDFNFNAKDPAYFAESFSKFIREEDNFQYHQFISEEIEKVYPEYWKEMDLWVHELYGILKTSVQLSSAKIRNQKHQIVKEALVSGQYKQVLGLVRQMESLPGSLPSEGGEEFVREYNMLLGLIGPMKEVLTDKLNRKGNSNSFKSLFERKEKEVMSAFWTLLRIRQKKDVFIQMLLNEVDGHSPEIARSAKKIRNGNNSGKRPSSQLKLSAMKRVSLLNSMKQGVSQTIGVFNGEISEHSEL